MFYSPDQKRKVSKELMMQKQMNGRLLWTVSNFKRSLGEELSEPCGELF